MQMTPPSHDFIDSSFTRQQSANEEKEFCKITKIKDRLKVDYKGGE